ncbi:MAG: fluoride efflux transporter CrcB [Elusimicrobia bacterium]|nr:fluoride efflux transporter CrcB [Elusimicrobiota bacterium]
MGKWTNLLVGTLAGGVARYVLAGAVYRVLGTNFPYGTLVVNLSGCLAIGILDALAEDKFLLGPEARVLLMVGFCGAFTTFSTLILETDHLLRDGEWARAVINAGGSLILGLLLFRLGLMAARAL